MMKNKDIECYQLFPKELVINTDFIMIFRIILTGFVLLSLTGVASAADYYVSNYGNNSGDGLSIENSWATPSYAAQQVIAGDTIYLINGTWYNDHVVFSNSGNATHPITLTSYTGTPTLDGVDKTGVGIKLNGQNYITINGLKVTQYMQTIAADASHDVNITNCDLSNTSGSLIILSIGGAHNNLLEGNTMYDSGWNTVQLSGSREPPNGNGIPATNITVRNNVIYNSNVHSSIDIFGNVENITIEGNLFYNSTDGDIYFHSTTDTAKTVLIHNNTWNATGMQKNLISFPDAGSSLYLHENITITNNIFRNTKSTVKAIHIGHVDSLYAAYNNYYNVAIPSETLSGTDVIFYKNYIDDDSGSHISLYGSSAITVRNPIGKHSIQPHSGGVATLEYDNNQVFVGSAGGSYASFVPTAYYPTHSNSTVVANSGNQAWLHSTLYQMSMTPSTNTSSMRINKFNTSEIVNNVAVNFTANSTDGTKVDFLIWDLLSNHHYLIKKDGTNFTTTQANSTGYIQFSNSEWSEHTFTIEETSHAVVIDVESDTPVSITPSTQTVAPNQPFTLTIP
ncbi:hypothetical protein KAR91_58265, partial [Candidatus Pacearchaeota archaeon]|nr:hypothetical protein [Candidatus Pacearchaeota archaeon]